MRCLISAAGIAAFFATSSAMAATDIQWWHAMTGANNDVIVKLAEEFNAAQIGLQCRPELQGRLCRHDECRNCGIPRRQCAAHPAGLRSRHGDDDGARKAPSNPSIS